METIWVMMTRDYEKIAKELGAVCSDVRVNEPMSKHTTIGVGGPARFFAVPASAEEVIALVATAQTLGLDYIGVGRGSNLVVLDGGYDGLVVRVASNLGHVEVRDDSIYAEAGVSFTRLGRIASKNDRPGFEFAIGIPGSVGGAVRMNAGAYGSELARILRSARAITRDGDVVEYTPRDLDFEYRHSALPHDAIVLSTVFNAPTGEVDPEKLKQSESRKDTQPLAERSFGSTFRNPEGAFAAELIEKAGLKGVRRGGAMISEKHANFMVNTGGCVRQRYRRLDRARDRNGRRPFWNSAPTGGDCHWRSIKPNANGVVPCETWRCGS